LRQYQLVHKLFEQTNQSFSSHDGKQAEIFIRQGLQDTDQRYAANKSLSEAYLFAVLLWYPVQQVLESYNPAAFKAGTSKTVHMQSAFDEVLGKQSKQTSIMRVFCNKIRGIWMLQYRLAHRYRKDLPQWINNPNFKGAYDFLLLRAKADESLNELAQWWTSYYVLASNNEKKRLEMHAIWTEKASRKKKIKKIKNNNSQPPA
jgi:poly(A) polymerase